MKLILVHISIWLPAVMGALFPALVKLNHWMFQQSTINARDAIGIEMLFLAICALTVVAQLPLAIVWICKRKWWRLPCILVSVVVCIVLVIVGVQCGAAILYAT